jgi:hypothetical protein
MRVARAILGTSLLAMTACSSGTSKPDEVVLSPSSAAAPAPGGDAFAYFDGVVDPKAGTMTLTMRAPSGDVQPQVAAPITLPYGTTADHAFFHTCSSAYNPGTHQLTGSVQGVNQMSKTVTNFTAVIDSISATGVTLATGTPGATSGMIASYGTTAPGGVGCPGNAQPWAFQNTITDTPFTFKGHASAVAQLIKVVDATYGLNCNAALQGNHTSFLNTECNGKLAPCVYPSDPPLSKSNILAVSGDPAFGCAKTWIAHYQCNGGPVKTLTVAAESGFSTGTLTCP